MLKAYYGFWVMSSLKIKIVKSRDIYIINNHCLSTLFGCGVLEKISTIHGLYTLISRYMRLIILVANDSYVWLMLYFRISRCFLYYFNSWSNSHLKNILLAHMIKHREENLLQCRLCDKSYFQKLPYWICNFRYQS